STGSCRQPWPCTDSASDPCAPVASLEAEAEEIPLVVPGTAPVGGRLSADEHDLAAGSRFKDQSDWSYCANCYPRRGSWRSSLTLMTLLMPSPVCAPRRRQLVPSGWTSTS